MAVETTVSLKENSRSDVGSSSNSTHIGSTPYFESAVKKKKIVTDSLGNLLRIDIKFY